MPVANSSNITTIQILRSYSNSAPVTLDDGQLAYSFISNTLFIGSNTGIKVISNPPTDLRAQEAYNQANTATVLANAAYFHANGAFLKANASFDQANVTIGVDAGQNNRMTIIEGTDLSQNVRLDFSNTRMTISDGVNVGQNNRMTISDGVNTSQNVRLDFSNTRMAISDGVNTSQNVRLDFSNTRMTIIDGVDAGQNARMTIIEGVNVTQNTDIANKLSLTGASYQTVSGNVAFLNDVSVSGNLIVLGNTISLNVTSLEVKDTLIQLGIGNYNTDVLTIGYVGHYNDGTNAQAGMIRDAGTKEFYAFQGYTPGVTGNTVNINDASFAKANIQGNWFKGNLIATTARVGGLDVNSRLDFSNTRMDISDGVNISQNVRLNFSNTRMTIIEGVDVGQNTRLTVSEGVDLSQNVRLDYSNTALTIAQGVDNSQNVRLDYSNTAITIIQGVDVGQNARMAIIEGTDTSQNVRLDFSNTRMTVSDGVNASQNVRLDFSNTRMTIIEGVDVTQNTNISTVTVLAQAAFNRANTEPDSFNYLANTVIVANSTGYLSNSRVFFTSSNNNLIVSGNVQVSNGSITTPATELTLGVTGDTFGAQYLRLQNRGGQNGPLFDGTSSSAALVDFGFKTVNGQRNIRYETRSAYKYIPSGDGLEFQIGDPNAPTFIISNNSVYIAKTTTSTSTTTGALIVGGGAGIAGNVHSGMHYITGSGNGIVFVDSTVQTTAGSSVANTVYLQGVDNSQNVRLDYSNTALTIAQGVDNSQNVRLDFSNTRMTIADGVDASQNVRLDYSNTAITIIQGVDAGQNARMTIIEGVNASQNSRLDYSNTALTIAQGVDNSQNVRIDYSNAAITIIQGVDVGQNSRMTIADGVDASQNVRLDYSNAVITIIQGVDVTQNTRLTVSEGVDLSQNVRLDFSNTRMNIIDGVDAGQNARMTIIEGVDVTQNTNISNRLALSGASLQTVTGNVVFGNDVTVTGNLIVLGNTISLNVTSIEVEDTLIQLGIGNYSTDALTIGYVGHYNDGTNAHAGMIRDAVTKEFYAFQGYTPEVSGNVINVNAASFTKANIHGNWFKGNLIATTARVGGLDVNSRLDFSNTRMTIIEGVDVTQNTNIAATDNKMQGAYNVANTADVRSVAAYFHANGAFIKANAAFDQANVTIGVDASQNSRMTIIENTDVSQNVRLAFSNTRMDINDGVNVSQNVRLDYSNTALTIAQGVDNSQNVRLDYSNTAINQVSSAWTANTVIVANSAGFLSNSAMSFNSSTSHLHSMANLSIGTSAASAPLTVSKSFTLPTGSEQFNQFNAATYTFADSGLKQNLRLNTSATHTSNTLNELIGILNLNQASGVGGTTLSQYGFWARNDVAAGAFVTNSYNYFSNNGANLGNANNQFGFYTANLTKGLLSNYGFYGGVNTGNNAYNLYMAGTAPNYLAGSLTVANNVPSTSNTTGSLVVTGGLGVSGNTFLNNSLAAVTTTASAVNYVQVTGGTTTVDAKISAQGSDTNVGMSYSSKGSFFHRFWTNNFNNEQFRIVHTASSVNYLQITGATTGNAPTITVEGSDSNIPLNIAAKLAAPINFFTSGGYQQFKINNTATAVNYLEVTGGTASGPNGNGASISVQGSSTDADMYLAAKGLGRINVASKMIVGNAAFGTYPSTIAPFDGLIVANTITGGAIGFGGTNGRSLSAYQGAGLSNFDFNAAQVYYSGDLLVQGKISSPNSTSANLRITTTDANATILIDRTVYISNANNSVSNTTGGLVVQGGIATGGAIYSTGGSITINNGLATTGNSGTIFLGDGSFTKTYGSLFTFSGGVSTTTLYGTTQVQAGAGTTTSPSYGLVGTSGIGMYFPTTGTIGFVANTANALFVVAPTSSVNHLQVSANTTGNPVRVSSVGSDANVNLNLVTQGSGTFSFLNSNTTNGLIFNKNIGSNEWTITANNTSNLGLAATGGGQIYFYTSTGGALRQFVIATTSSAVNYLQVTGNTTGGGAVLSAQGSDTNVGININPKGAGSVNVTSATSSTSNTTGALIVNGGLGLSGNLSMNLTSNGVAVNRITLTPINHIESNEINGHVRFAGSGYYYFSNSNGVYIDGLLRPRGPIINDTGNTTVLFGGSSQVKIQNGTGSSNTTTGALVVQGGVGISGALNATTKSFNIPHPTKEGKDLRYGSLEGPEFGVYVRGTLKGSNVIELPDYWTKLVDADTITVSLTPIGKYQKLSVKEVKDNTIIINSDGWFKKEIHCYYTVFGERADVDKLDVEG